MMKRSARIESRLRTCLKCPRRSAPEDGRRRLESPGTLKRPTRTGLPTSLRPGTGALRPRLVPPAKRVFKKALRVLLAAAWLGVGVTVFAAPPVPLTQAHAHNDYLQRRPLFDALEQGFCSVEADIYLVADRLLVAHDLENTKPERTLQALYLDPLRERVRKNGGRVFRGGPEFSLLIDLKSDWQTTYPVLRAVLSQYGEILTTFQSGVKRTNAITVIVTGKRSKEMFDGENVRLAAYDGTMSDLDSSDPATFIPWISADWNTLFKWKGAGALPADEQRRLAGIVTRAHQQGRRVRFWGAPDNRNFWEAMRTAGVDLINTDDLEGLKKFFQGW